LKAPGHLPHIDRRHSDARAVEPFRNQLVDRQKRIVHGVFTGPVDVYMRTLYLANRRIASTLAERAIFL
jgi:hypothetical protein